MQNYTRKMFVISLELHSGTLRLFTKIQNYKKKKIYNGVQIHALYTNKKKKMCTGNTFLENGENETIFSRFISGKGGRLGERVRAKKKRCFRWTRLIFFLFPSPCATTVRKARRVHVKCALIERTLPKPTEIVQGA